MPTREVTGLKELVALIGEGASFSGKLVFEGRVRIDGHFSGEVYSDDVLVLGETAEVDAQIRVGSLIVLGGTLRGEVTATRAVELHAPARVHGNITAPQLAIDRGVVFEGQSRIPDANVEPTFRATTGNEPQPIESEVDPAPEPSGEEAAP